MITADQITRTVLADLGADSLHGYDRLLSWCLRGVKEIHKLYGHNGVSVAETKVLELTDYRTARLPDNYVKWLAVGFLVGDRLIAFKWRPEMIAIHDHDNCGVPQPLESCRQKALENGFVFGPYTNSFFIGGSFYGDWYPGVYGNVNTDRRPGFTINSDTHEIVFDKLLPLTSDYKIVLRYKTDGLNYSGDTSLHTYYEEALISFIHWKRCLFGKDKSDASYHRQEFYSQAAEAHIRLNIEPLNDFIRKINKYTIQAPAY